MPNTAINIQKRFSNLNEKPLHNHLDSKNREKGKEKIETTNDQSSY